MIKLCYKKYKWKISQGACRSFKEKTNKDLFGFFASYITASLSLPDMISDFEQCEVFRNLHDRDDACQALHCIISEASDGIPIEEIEDATYRVSWMPTDRPDSLSEPWPMVMREVAFEINEYMNKNMPLKKKAVT